MNIHATAIILTPLVAEGGRTRISGPMPRRSTGALRPSGDDRADVGLTGGLIPARASHYRAAYLFTAEEILRWSATLVLGF